MNNFLNTIKKNTTFQGGANYEDFQIEKFLEILNKIKTKNPSMIELGSNDCFYSILFNKFFEKSEDLLNVCVEVSSKLINLGKINTESNNCKNFKFKHSKIGTLDQQYFDMISESDPNLWGDLSIDVTSIKDLINEFQLKEISILHMDIQGSEIFVLKELEDLDINIKYMFISTHPESAFGSTHEKCINSLKNLNFKILFSDESNGGYGDGLIICEKINKTNEQS